MVYEVARFNGSNVMGFRFRLLEAMDQNMAEVECIGVMSRTTITLRNSEIHGLLKYLQDNLKEKATGENPSS